ncbi:unnamed protein product [Trichobilharzia regenti]|nr:unnamed protein product [Trichobilharzia regenti]
MQLHENLLINLLQNGYHQTFSEIFYLIDFEEKRRLQHGISSPYWYATQLTERRDILAELMTHLINAENAYRLNHIEEICKSLLAIYKPKPRISSEDNDDNDDDDQPSKLLSYLNEALDYAEKCKCVK